MKMTMDAYLSGGASGDDPRVSPLRADLAHFPPACLICGTWDPLFGESEALHRRLQAAGRRSVLHSYDAMPHAFMQLAVSDADAAMAAACRFVRNVTT
jgi:epsilon-lactone hydrolase